MRARIRRICYWPRDFIDQFTGERADLKPPRSLMNVGPGDFREFGKKYLGHFIHIGGLTASDRVLDVGCGIGHIAIALTDYLDDRGSYEGFDIVEQGIQWCHTHVTPRFPNFRFQRVDIYNGEYNPKGAIAPSEFVFPYEDNSFDFVLVTSVFTHMRLGDIERYLAEIRRVLRTGGRCFATVLLTDTSVSMEGGPGLERFRYDVGECKTIDERSPEKALAYPEDTIRRTFGAHGLRVMEPIHYGEWRKHGNLLGSQDVIVAAR
jgi:ubiquinone/menaquinone biosynthesis C-methylase UbiE